MVLTFGWAYGPGGTAVAGKSVHHAVTTGGGVEQTSMLICAVGTQETSNAIVELAIQQFPHIQLLVRASDRFHAYALMKHGVAFPYRDGVETAVRMGVDALRAMGRRAFAATRAGSQFLRYDEASMAEQERLLTLDIQVDHTQGDHAWDSEPMRRGTNPT